MITINWQMQNVIRNRGRNLESMKVYSFFIFNVLIGCLFILKDKITAKNRVMGYLER